MSADALPPRRVPGVAGRGLRLLLALLPGAALSAAAGGDLGLAGRLLLAVALALGLEAIALGLRRQPLRLAGADGGGAAIAALLLVLWLPGLSGPALLLAVLAQVLVRQAFGGPVLLPFHPAMAAAAGAQWLSASAPPALAGASWAAVAWALGGLWLWSRGLLRWQAPLGLFAGAALANLATGGDPRLLASAPWLLAAVFIAPDPVPGCEQPRARLLYAFAIGALAVAASPPGRVDALPFAVLAMNALAPALDRWLESPRRAATS